MDHFARQQLVITLDGKDLTGGATVVSSDPQVADLQPSSYLIAKKDGSAQLTVTAAGKSATVAVSVKNSNAPNQLTSKMTSNQS